MSLDRAVAYALSESEPEVGIESGPLSRRECEVAKLVAAGLTNRQIGQRLFIAERSAEGHIERIRDKLGVRSRTEIATWAVERGLVTEHATADLGRATERVTRDGPPSPRR